MTKPELDAAELAYRNLISLQDFRAGLDNDDSTLIKAIAASVTSLSTAYPTAAADIKAAIISLVAGEVTAAGVTFGAL